MEKLYYLQNIEQGCVGNALVWRKYDNNGYTCKLKEAKQFTEKEALELCEGRGKFRAYPVEYIQANEGVYEIVDGQYLDKKEALKHV